MVACSGARQTFVPVTAEGDPIGKGILWSDHRAAAEARTLAEQMGGDDINRARTGIPLDAGAVAAKLAWLADARARAPRGGATSCCRRAT